MINTIPAAITGYGEWTNITEIKANTKYTLSFKVDNNCQIGIHLHTKDNNCISPLPIFGNRCIANRTYSYPLIAPQDGYLAMKGMQNTTIYDIVVEEV